MQTQLQEQISQMQTNMYIAHDLMVEISSSASSLQSTIEDTSTKFAQITMFSSMTAGILRWGWMLLPVFVIYHLSPKYTGHATAALGRFLSLPFQKNSMSWKYQYLPSLPKPPGSRRCPRVHSPIWF